MPIIILTKERPLQLADMLQSIRRATFPGKYRFYICDNNSQDPNMKSLLRHLHQYDKVYTVIFNRTNNGFAGINPALKMIKEKYFIISDPDIVLNDKTLDDWIVKLQAILENYLVPKVGLALDLNFKINNEYTDLVKKCEKFYYKFPVKIDCINEPCFIAPIDTTLAMYRRDTFSFWKEPTLNIDENILSGVGQIPQNLYNKKYNFLGKRMVQGCPAVIRVGGRYTAKHLGWDMSEKYESENNFYYKTGDRQLSSILRYRKKKLNQGEK